MKRSHRDCQDIHDGTGLIHHVSLLHEDVPVERCAIPFDHRIQLIEPQERRLPPFMMQVKAEMQEKVFVAQGPAVEAHPSLSHGPPPYRLHGFDVDQRWIGQSPMRFHEEAVIRMNEFQ